MLGFTLPLFAILGAEGLVGGLLLCPSPMNQPAIKLARATYTQVGSTVFYTVTGVLLLLLASPVFDGVSLYYSKKDKPEQATLDLNEQEARTLLSLTLTSACLAMMFFLRCLGRSLGALDRMNVSEAALLKQVKGMQSEYTRMADSADDKPDSSAPAAAGAGVCAPSNAEAAAAGGPSSQKVSELRRQVADLEKMNGQLQAEMASANKDQASAESNLAALKTQTKGLENEYDRLLAESDELKRQLARSGLGGTAGIASGGMAKKDE